MHKKVKVYSRGDERTGSMFTYFPVWGWEDKYQKNKVWRWLEKVEYVQKYLNTRFYKGWSRYTWTDL